MGLIIFFLILCTSLLFVRPFLKGVNGKLSSSLGGLIVSLREKTGLEISYGSLSPSVFSGIRINDIVLSDSFDGEAVLKIKNISLHYSFFKILKKDFSHIFTDLSVEGITVELDKEDDKLLIEKLMSLAQSNSESSSSSFSVIDFFELNKLFDIYIKNVHFRYSMGSDTADAFFKKLSLNIQGSKKSLSAKTSGSLLFYRGETGESLSMNFGADGNVLENLDGSSVNLRLSDFTDGNFNFKRLNLLLSYDSEKVTFTTVKNSYPFVTGGFYDFATSDAEVFLNAKNLTVGNLISSKKTTKILNVLDNLVLNADGNLKYNANTKNLSYKMDSSVKVSPKLFSGGENISFLVRGNEKQVFLDRFECAGERLNAEFSGNYTFKNFRLSGIFSLYNYTLPTGGNISTEIFIEPEAEGFMAFSPQLLFDEKAFTALQLKLIPEKDSFDFSFQVSDYAHYDYDKPGEISVMGSFLKDSKYVELNLSASDMFIDSVSEAGLFFAGKKKDLSFLSPYLFNAELYLSSDMKTVSYNIPYILVANTSREDQFLFASIDGNDTSLSVSRVDFINGGELSNLSLQLDISPDRSEAFFTLDANHGSIPYQLSGNVMEGAVSVSGDWNLAFDLRSPSILKNVSSSEFSEKESFGKASGKSSGKVSQTPFEGTFSVENFPVKVQDSIFTFSVDSVFSFSENDGISVIVNRFEAEDTGSKFNFHPRLILSGSISKYGAFFENISYSDKFSALSGPLNLVWNINEGVFSSANLDFALKNQISSESVEISAEVTNTDLEGESGASLKDSLYLSSQVVIKNLGLSRFLPETSDNNQLSGTFIASGTLDNPYIAAEVESVKLMTMGNLLTVKGSLYLEDKELSVSGLNIDYSALKLSGIKADFDLQTFTGKAEASFVANLGAKNLKVPMLLTLSDTVMLEGKMVPEEFALNLSLNPISGSLLKKEIPLELTVLHSGGTTSVFTSELFGLSGYISEDGNMNFSVPSDRTVSFSIEGNALSDLLDIHIKNILVNVPKLVSYFNIDDLNVERGVLRGNLDIGGMKSDPDFEGKLVLSPFDFTLSSVFPGKITGREVNALFEYNTVTIPEFKANVKKSSSFYASAALYFDRWNFDRFEANVRTDRDSYIPLNLNVPVAELKGDVCTDLVLVFQDGYLDVDGYLFLKNTNARISTRDLITTQSIIPKFNQAQAPVPSVSAPFVHTNLDIAFGQHVNFTFDPVLRAVFVPDTKFNFKCDTEDNSFTIDGDILMRSGDIAYLSRNFYLKNGILRFNKNDTTINPYITLTAETREKDEDGNDVRIILSVTNQELLNFEPVFSSIPVKSENEIRTLLGQIAVGDSDNVSSLLLATGDYAIQSTIGRSLENTLREYLNFDIFSVRTKVLQNALKQNFNNSDDKQLAIGNYLDNSTVYMGKYFGSALYADALMHLTYDEGVERGSELRSSGLEFQPEIGFEMDISQMFQPLWNIFLPKIGLNPTNAVANIRWSLDFNYQPATAVRFDFNNAITLSWKFSF